jgi:hypothetical protein
MERRVRDAWIAGVAHAIGSTVILLTTGHNIVLAAHYPLASALAILLLAMAVRQRSRAAAALLTIAVLAPVTIKLILGVVHAADLPALPLAALYARGWLGASRLHRLRREG